MNTPNLLRNLWESLHDVGVLWQVAAAAASVLLAWLLCRLTRARIAALRGDPAVEQNSVYSLQFPILALVLVLIAQALMGGEHLSILELIVALLTAAVLIRFVVMVLRQVFAPSGWRDRMIRVIGACVWIGFALHVVGVLPELLKFLDALGFAVGKTRISLLLILQALLSVIATLLIALWLGRFIEARAMAAADLDINLRVMISKLAQALLVLAAILLALPAVGIDLTLLSVFGGALGVGLGFGLQKIASNYVSGFIILFDRSVTLGDLVTIDGHSGRLSKMTSRYVVVRSLGGVEAIIPNDTLIATTVVNQSYTDTRVRQAIAVQVGYDSDLDLALQLLGEIAQRQPRILADPKPNAHVVKFGDSGIDVELGFWVDDPEKGTRALRSDMHREIWREFRRHGIDIPYPQRVVRAMPGPTPAAGSTVSEKIN